MLEQVVRPFQTPQTIQNQTPVTTVDTVLPPRARLVWGASGATPIIQTNSFTIEDKHKEVSRKTSTIRVTNPDDDSQFVEVKRVDEITFDGTFTAVNANGSTNNGAGGSSGGVVTRQGTGSQEVVMGGGAPTNTAYAPAPAGATAISGDGGPKSTFTFKNDASS